MRKKHNLPTPDEMLAERVAMLAKEADRRAAIAIQQAQRQTMMAAQQSVTQPYSPRYATGASVGGGLRPGDRLGDTTMLDMVAKLVDVRFDQLIAEQNQLIATMQEQIEEIWQELRGE